MQIPQEKKNKRVAPGLESGMRNEVFFLCGAQIGNSRRLGTERMQIGVLRKKSQGLKRMMGEHKSFETIGASTHTYVPIYLMYLHYSQRSIFSSIYE
jgi:hypothetical protein